MLILFNIIGPRIAQARTAQNMSAEELCAKMKHIGIDLGPYKLSLIENQEAQIFDYQVPAFTEALGVSAEWLFQGFKYEKPFSNKYLEYLMDNQE